MKKMRGLVSIAIAIVAMLTFAGIGTVSAQEGEASVTIHKSTCPANTGSDIFERCHGNALPGIGFNVAGTNVSTGPDGHATAVVASGSITITEDADDAGSFKGAYVFCSEQGSGKILTNGPVTTRNVTINTNDGDEVICDWYNLTAPVVTTPTVGPNPTATATSVPVVHPTATATHSTTTLPNTGAGDKNNSTGSTVWIVGILLSIAAGAFTLRRRSLG